jgi:hypothetical protein
MVGHAIPPKKTFPESRIAANIDKLRLMKGYKAIKCTKTTDVRFEERERRQ